MPQAEISPSREGARLGRSVQPDLPERRRAREPARQSLDAARIEGGLQRLERLPRARQPSAAERGQLGRPHGRRARRSRAHRSVRELGHGQRRAQRVPQLSDGRHLRPGAHREHQSLHAGGRTRATTRSPWLNARANLGFDYTLINTQEPDPLRSGSVRRDVASGQHHRLAHREFAVHARRRRDGARSIRAAASSSKTSVGLQYYRTYNDQSGLSGSNYTPGATQVSSGATQSATSGTDLTITLGNVRRRGHLVQRTDVFLTGRCALRRQQLVR